MPGARPSGLRAGVVILPLRRARRAHWSRRASDSARRGGRSRGADDLHLRVPKREPWPSSPTATLHAFRCRRERETTPLPDAKALLFLLEGPMRGKSACGLSCGRSAARTRGAGRPDWAWRRKSATPGASGRTRDRRQDDETVGRSAPARREKKLHPSMRGMPRSSRISEDRPICESRSSAACPSSAVSTSKPSAARGPKPGSDDGIVVDEQDRGRAPRAHVRRPLRRDSGRRRMSASPERPRSDARTAPQLELVETTCRERARQRFDLIGSSSRRLVGPDDNGADRGCPSFVTSGARA